MAEIKTTETQSVSTRDEMEATTTMDNVSLEDDDVEQQKSSAPAGQASEGWAKGNLTTRRNAIMGVILLICIIVGVTAALVVGLGGKAEAARTESASTAFDASISVEASEGSEAAALPAQQTEEATSAENPFADAKLRGFSGDITEGYASVEEFETDLTKTAEYIAHNIIQWNLHHHSQHEEGAQNDDAVADVATVALDAGASVSSAAASKQATKKVSKTNNQEQNADEADVVKSDEKYVYAAHYSQMLVWDRQGNIVNRINTTTELNEWGYYDSHSIRAILLTDEHVVMVSEGYDSSDVSLGLYDRNATHVSVYTKPTDTSSDMELVGTKSFNGYYHDGRYMQDSDSIQILTGGGMRTWDLIDQLSPTYFPWMSKEDYAKKAAEKASKTLIPEFVRAVTRDIMNDGELPAMLKLNAWTVGEQTESWKQFGQYTLDQVMNSYTQVTSLSVADFGIEEELKGPAAVFFGPSTYPHIYGTDDNLVVAFSTSEWDEEEQHTHEASFLVNMNIVNQAAEFHSIAMLEGRINSQHSVDVQGTDLRVATTIQNWLPWDNVWASCGDSYYIYEDECLTESLYDQCQELALNCPQGKVIKSGCPYTFTCEINETEVEDPSSTENHVIVFDIEQKGQMKELGRVRIGEPHEIITSVRFGETFSFATTFDERDPFYVLKLEAGQAPTISGSVTLEGFPAYLHPMNAEHTMLVGIGQNTSGTVLDQRNSGVMVSVFDVSDPTNPKVVDSHMLDKDSSSGAEWDFKAVEYDEGKLIIPASVYQDTFWDDDHNWDNAMNFGNDVAVNSTHFEGFVVLDVQNTAGIQELFRVNHASKSGDCHYCDPIYFSEYRSFAYDDGSLMTIHDNVVISTNLTSGAEIWRMEPHNEGDEKVCCW